jgi:septum formation protein
MLRAAAITFEVAVPDVDEETAKARLLREGADRVRIADALAELKAVETSRRRPEALVLGADQVLDCEGRIFSKAASLDEARAALRALRGRKHRLTSAAVLARDEKPVWRDNGTAELWMRDFSDEFLEDYLTAEGDRLLSSVGCYRIEGRGAQLFSRVNGDSFVIRGLPLLPVLEALRERGILPR